MALGNDREERLNHLFAEYRAACPDTEPGANFMPTLWQRIEARRSPLTQWVMMSRRALVGAMALCLLLGIVMGTAISSSQFYLSTYIEELDDSQVTEDLAAMHPVSVESPAEAPARQ